MRSKPYLFVYKSGKKDYIGIRFKSNELGFIRFNTKYEYIPSKHTGMLYFKKAVTFSSHHNGLFDFWIEKMTEYIDLKADSDDRTISTKEFKKYLSEGAKIIQPEAEEVVEEIVMSKTMLEWYDLFYDFKKKELDNRPSVKDYLTLKNTLIDYQADHNCTLMLEDINIDFLYNYRKYLTEPRRRNSLTKGSLNDNTVNKRISSIKTFCVWLEGLDAPPISFPKKFYNFKTPTYLNTVVTFSKEELNQLSQLNITNPTWSLIRDITLLGCMVGLRYEKDLKRLKPYHIKQYSNGGYYIDMESRKTDVEVEIPLNKNAVEILKKYDFEIPFFEVHHYNREVKKMLQHYEMLQDVVSKKRKVIQHDNDYEVQRYKLISSHTLRRTFITLAGGNNIPIPKIQQATGLKKIQTIQRYMGKGVKDGDFDGIGF